MVRVSRRHQWILCRVEWAFSFLFLATCVFQSSASARSVPPRQASRAAATGSDAQAIAFAAQAVAAMSAGTTVADVVLTGQATVNVGNTSDSGTITLSALDVGESRVDITLLDGLHSQTRDASTGVLLGQWRIASGTVKSSALHNCRTDAAWFFPALGSLNSGANVILTYVGQEEWNGTSVQHIRSTVQSQDSDPSVAAAETQQSVMDFYLDAGSLLPTAIVFNSYPDNDPNTSLGIEVDFSNYETLGGVVVPTHIQKSLQGNVMYDITVTQAQINSGLPASMFFLQ